MNGIIRSLQHRVENALKPNKVVMIFGARRVGKTVLMNQIIKQFEGKTLILNGEGKMLAHYGKVT